MRVFWLLFLSADAARPTVRILHPDVARTREFIDVMPEELLQQLEKDCDALAEYNHQLPVLTNYKKQTYWFPNKVSPKTSFEEAIKYLQPLAKVGSNNAGAEWWIQKIPASGPAGTLGFHVDKDESVASLKHYLVHPEYSSVFYLTSQGGATLITDQWSPEGNGYEPKEPEEGELSLPQRNKYIVFNGELLHGVVPSRSETPGSRITFLVNFWDHVPEAPNCGPINYTAIAAAGVSVWSKQERSAWKKKRSNRKGFELPLTTVDLRPRTKTKPASYAYEIQLPGGAKQTVRLPLSVDPGSTSTIKWKKSTKTASVETKAKTATIKDNTGEKAPTEPKNVDQANKKQVEQTQKADDSRQGETKLSKGPPPTMAPKSQQEQKQERRQQEEDRERQLRQVTKQKQQSQQPQQPQQQQQPQQPQQPQQQQQQQQQQPQQQRQQQQQPQQPQQAEIEKTPARRTKGKEDYSTFRKSLEQTVNKFQADE